jgi:peptidoglycan/xylan/chitin deacetylase (PgdA/CDA1 family)
MRLLKKVIVLSLYPLCLLLRKRGLTVLTYHRISDEPDYYDPLKVSVLNFEKQVNFLKKNYTIISGDQLAQFIKLRKSPPKNSCLITFDDGWLDNYKNAYPILKEHEIPAIIFVSTDYIGTHKGFWHESLKTILSGEISNINFNLLDELNQEWPEEIQKKLIEIPRCKERIRYSLINELIICLKKYDTHKIYRLIEDLQILLKKDQGKEQALMLNWEQVRKMSMDGITMGSHTKSHDILTNLSLDKVKSEVIDSKRILEKKIDKPVHYF